MIELVNYIAAYHNRKFSGWLVWKKQNKNCPSSFSSDNLSILDDDDNTYYAITVQSAWTESSSSSLLCELESGENYCLDLFGKPSRWSGLLEGPMSENNAVLCNLSVFPCTVLFRCNFTLRLKWFITMGNIVTHRNLHSVCCWNLMGVWGICTIFMLNKEGVGKPFCTFCG